jgi:hypothetical protein
MAKEKEKAGGCGALFLGLALVIWAFSGCLEKVGLIEPTINSYQVGTKKLNLRKLANPNSEVIKELQEKDSLFAIENKSKSYKNETWVYVTDKIDTGWVNETYLN